MKYMDIGCNIKCWECPRSCSIKDLLALSIILLDIPEISIFATYKNNDIMLDSKNILNFFYFTILDFLKSQAGLLISEGKDFSEVQKDIMELAVAFYVARLKAIESIED